MCLNWPRIIRPEVRNNEKRSRQRYSNSGGGLRPGRGIRRCVSNNATAAALCAADETSPARRRQSAGQFGGGVSADSGEGWNDLVLPPSFPQRRRRAESGAGGGGKPWSQKPEHHDQFDLSGSRAADRPYPKRRGRRSGYQLHFRTGRQGSVAGRAGQPGDHADPWRARQSDRGRAGPCRCRLYRRPGLRPLRQCERHDGTGGLRFARLCDAGCRVCRPCGGSDRLSGRLSASAGFDSPDPGRLCGHGGKNRRSQGNCFRYHHDNQRPGRPEDRPIGRPSHRSFRFAKGRILIPDRRRRRVAGCSRLYGADHGTARH